jgi:hypothetical protein
MHVYIYLIENSVFEDTFETLAKAFLFVRWMDSDDSGCIFS